MLQPIRRRDTGHRSDLGDARDGLCCNGRNALELHEHVTLVQAAGGVNYLRNSVKAIMDAYETESKRGGGRPPSGAIGERVVQHRPLPPRPPDPAAMLDNEVTELEWRLDELTRKLVPELRQCIGVGQDVAAALVLTAGLNGDRIRSEASFSICVALLRFRPHRVSRIAIDSIAVATAKPTPRCTRSSS